MAEAVKHPDHPATYTVHDGYKIWIPTGGALRNMDPIPTRREVGHRYGEIEASGPILGPTPDGVNAWGKPDVIYPRWVSYGSGGSALLPRAGGVFRTAVNGVVGAFGVYHRFQTIQHFDPPYEFSIDMRVNARKYPYTFEWGGTAGYEPGVVIHPMHDMWHTPTDGNKENVLFRFGSLGQTTVSASAEIDGKYGYRTGFVKRTLGPSFDPVGKGWFKLVATVHSHAHYTLHSDGVLLADITEKLPTTLVGAVGIGLRFDFLDVEIRNSSVRSLA